MIVYNQYKIKGAVNPTATRLCDVEVEGRSRMDLPYEEGSMWICQLRYADQ